MKPYLVDVPVRVNIWIRPECQRKQFEIIKKQDLVFCSLYQTVVEMIKNGN